MAHPPEYTVEQWAEDDFVVKVDGRSVLNSAHDLQEAVEAVERDGGKHYTFVYPDGYREERDTRDIF